MKRRAIIMIAIALVALSAMGVPGLDTDTTPKFKANFSMTDLERDAQNGNADAQCCLGFCNLLGINTAVDINKGLEWFEKSANQGYQAAMGIMGMFYMEGSDKDLRDRDSLGITLQPDNKKACDLFRQLPVRKKDFMNEYYRYRINYSYTSGPHSFFSVPYGKDETEYLKELEQEATAGNPTAQYMMACYYMGYSDEMDGMDVTELEAARKARREKEMYWLGLAAEQGHADAQLKLGMNLLDYEYNSVLDNSEAIRWFKAATDQGDVNGMMNLANCYLTCENPDTAQAVALYRRAAECGNEDAQFFLANCYYLGKGVPQDYSEAFKLYQQLSQQEEYYYGLANINEILGDCYLYGHGVEKNLDKAFEYYSKIKESCFDSFDYPNFQMAQYYEGKNQESKALEYYKKAADDNFNTTAASMLAGYYYEGSHGFPQDYKQAAQYYSMAIDFMPDTTGWFRTIKDSFEESFPVDTVYEIPTDADSVTIDTTAAVEALDESRLFDMEKYADRDFYKQAASGDAQAQLKLGKMLLEGDTAFQCITNNDLAIEWFEKAALQGNAEAQYLLAQCYNEAYHESPKAFDVHYDAELGDYVEDDDDNDDYLVNQEKAMFWYLQAAQNGIPEAQLEVGSRYYLEGINEKDAFQWYLKAAQAGLAEAQYNVGEFYSDGELVKQNYSEAVKWYKKAAEQGHLSSCEELGECYIDGEGVARDVNQGIYWLERAARGGRTDVATSLGKLYAEGKKVGQNYNKAIYWYTIGASSDNESRNSLGELYRDGRGTARDYKKAVYWFRRAAEDDFTEAQLNLSQCYKNGWGVKKSASQAKYWENKAKEETIDIIHDVEF